MRKEENLKKSKETSFHHTKGQAIHPSQEFYCWVSGLIWLCELVWLLSYYYDSVNPPLLRKREQGKMKNAKFKSALILVYEIIFGWYLIVSLYTFVHFGMQKSYLLFVKWVRCVNKISEVKRPIFSLIFILKLVYRCCNSLIF